MYDISSMGNSATGEARASQLEALSRQRWTDAENGSPEFRNSYPDAPVEEVPADMTGNNAEFYSFYGTKRGWHPNALAGVTTTSMLSLMNFPSLAHINEIAPRPMIMGQEAPSGERKVAFVRCNGGTNAAKRYEYVGVKDCLSATKVAGGPLECQFGCLGFGSCVSACQFGAMSIGPNGAAVVDPDKCTDCMACAKACPRHLIDRSKDCAGSPPISGHNS